MAAVILSAVAAHDVQPLLALAAAENPEEALQGLSAKELTHMWQLLAPFVEQKLEEAGPAMGVVPEEDEDGAAPPPVDDAAVGAALEALQAVTILARASLSDADRETPTELLEVAIELHDIIFDLKDPRADVLQDAIVDLCEAWWLGGRDGRDELMPQTISYLLVRALHANAGAADVKRLYVLRSALTVLDYSDESTAHFKRLLLHCVIRPLVLRVAEGRKLLAYLFTLHEPFVADLHRAVKSQIPSCRKSQRAAYGEVYLRAWKASPGGAWTQRIEEGCVQDLMWHALHAASSSMASAVRQVLAPLHDAKRQRGVDAMLLKLWEPILWRALKCANPHVRKNAATLFVEAFPLQDATMPAVDLDATLQGQFDHLSRILKDDSVQVRVVACHGACRVLALYWEMIPPSTAKGLLTALVKDLAHDASANTVRVAALQGLNYLLVQNGSLEVATALKASLPHVAPLLRDGSERVRVALLELLLSCAKLKSAVLHWPSAIAPEALLRQLPSERPPLQMRMTRLLLPHFLPMGKPAAMHEKARAFLALAASGTPAAKAFLSHAPRFATTAACLRLIRLHLGAILSGDDASPAALLEAASPSSLPPRAAPMPLPQLAASLDALATLVDAVAPDVAPPPAARAAARARRRRRRRPTPTPRRSKSSRASSRRRRGAAAARRRASPPRAACSPTHRTPRRRPTPASSAPSLTRRRCAPSPRPPARPSARRAR